MHQITNKREKTTLKRKSIHFMRTCHTANVITGILPGVHFESQGSARAVEWEGACDVECVCVDQSTFAVSQKHPKTTGNEETLDFRLDGNLQQSGGSKPPQSSNLNGVRRWWRSCGHTAAYRAYSGMGLSVERRKNDGHLIL